MSSTPAEKLSLLEKELLLLWQSIIKWQLEAWAVFRQPLSLRREWP